MTEHISYERLKAAYKKAAIIVCTHGEVYLPIFERLEKELMERKHKKDILSRAIEISKIDL